MTGRVRDKELEGAIHTLDKNVQPPKKTDPRTVVFTISGKENFCCPIDDTYFPDTKYPVLLDKRNKKTQEVILAGDLDDACAKLVFTNDDITRYYIKRGIDGSLYNPIGLFIENTHNKLQHDIRKEWEFSSVSRDVFRQYLNFLKTRNQAWLTTAQRDLV